MRCIWRQILSKVAPKISEAQFGGVPGKGTREAVLVATEIIARFHKATKGPVKSRNPPMYKAAVLFDLEKAFDKVDRPSPVRQSTDGEEMHHGTFYKIRDHSGQMQRKVLISKGVLQGSVEEPLIFVAFDDLVLHGAGAQGGGSSITETRSGDEVVAPANEIAFVDDLLSFLIFMFWEHLTGWI